jgi:hypothetical protein
MKKLLLTAVVSLTLSGAAMAAPDNVQDPETAVTTEVAVSPQTAIDVDPTPSGEVDYIEESQVAKRMTQAEKAHNAAVNDSWGGAITIIAMCIVVGALVILSLLFLAFGKISEAFMAKKKSQSITAAKTGGESSPAAATVDSGDVIAAIGLALSEHFGDGHDMEDTILTIRRMKRAYSPWNSKIYNLRQLPELHKNEPGRSAF